MEFLGTVAWPRPHVGLTLLAMASIPFFPFAEKLGQIATKPEIGGPPGGNIHRWRCR